MSSSTGTQRRSVSLYASRRYHIEIQCLPKGRRLARFASSRKGLRAEGGQRDRNEPGGVNFTRPVCRHADLHF